MSMIRMILICIAATVTIGVLGYLSTALFMPVNWWVALLLMPCMGVFIGFITVRICE